MASETPQVVFDNENPEWTDADFAAARPIGDFPALATALPNGKRSRGRPKGSLSSDKSQVTLRIDNDILDRFKASGKGWQSRINEALRSVAP